MVGHIWTLVKKKVKSKMRSMLFAKLPEIKCFQSYAVFVVNMMMLTKKKKHFLWFS
jgi:hypothetical protein